MKKPLHPAALVATLIVGCVLVIGIFARFGSGAPPAKSDSASPYAQVGQRPASAGSGVNSLTGEPLPETAKAYEEATYSRNMTPPAGGVPAGR